MDGELRRPRAFLNLDKIDSGIHEKLLRALVEEAPVGTFIISSGEKESEGRIIYANPDFLRYIRAYGRRVQGHAAGLGFYSPGRPSNTR